MKVTKLITCLTPDIKICGHNQNYTNTVKHVLRGHFCDKENEPYKTGSLLKEANFIWKFSIKGQEKGDLSVQVTV